MYNYKVTFIDMRNNPINHVYVQANNAWEAFEEARKEYSNRKWEFMYWDLAAEAL